MVAGGWRRALERLGWVTFTVAGEGPVDRTLPGLAIEADIPPAFDDLATALESADLVVVENLLSIPLNLGASKVLAQVLRGRPAILHHHDPPWQRQRFVHITELPPDDPAWAHVTINRLTEREFAQRGLTATTIYNGFDVDPPPGDRAGTRDRLDVEPNEILAAHPVRAIARKNIPAALELCRRIGATYWIPGDVEEGYGPEFEPLVAASPVRIIRRAVDRQEITMPDLYAACDLVVFPSTWEGFGNPPIEAAIHCRPVAVGHYPVAEELRELGFRWLDPDRPDELAAALTSPPTTMLDTNHRLAVTRLSHERMTADIAELLASRGWRP